MRAAWVVSSMPSLMESTQPVPLQAWLNSPMSLCSTPVAMLLQCQLACLSPTRQSHQQLPQPVITTKIHPSMAPPISTPLASPRSIDGIPSSSTVGTALLTNSVFAGTDTLVALMHNKITTIFGKNAGNVVYYTSCHVDQLANPTSWSAPVPILQGMERITSDINLKDGGNTVFAAGGSKIQKLTQATNTVSKLWHAQPIMLETSPEGKAIKFNSYTSTIQVKGKDDLPVV